MKRFEGIIFDLDGVLCHTDEYHYLAWQALADRLGVPFDRGVNERLRGVSRMESLEIILERAGRTYTDAEKSAFADEKNEMYRGFLARMTPDDLPRGVRETLAVLRARGYRLAIGSSSKNTPLILERLALTGAFDAVADGNEITRSKPDPEVFLLAAQKLALPPAGCLVVEDAESGVSAAVAGGFTAAGIGSAKDDPRVTFRLDTLSDLAAVLP
mgnify:CR=1 FL=1